MDRAAPPAPASLSGWIADLWSRVLFPAAAPPAEPARLRSLLVLLILPATLLYPCLGFHLFEPDESRYAQIPREMLARGDMVVPTLQGEPYLDKPPLFYWLVAGSYRAFGVHDWSARLVPALAVHATLLLVYLGGRRLAGERAAFRAALVLALAPAFLGVARLLILDGLLTLWTTLALFAAFEALRGPRLRWGPWLLAALACGLGVLTKGPVALVLLAPPLWLHRRLAPSVGQPARLSRGEDGQAGRLAYDRPGARVSPAALAAFAAVVAAVALPWYVALCWRLPGFLSYFFWEHNLKRFLMPGMHARGVWFYLPVLFVLLLPGALAGVSFLRFLLRPADAGKRTPELGFLLLASGWCVFFFSLSAGKLPTYVLPALPPLALALGHFLVHGRYAASPWPARLATASFVLVLALHTLAVPWYAAYRSPMSRPAEVLALCTDPATPVVCYPRNCDSVAFYLGRADLRTFRSKDIEELRYLVRVQPRTVVLCTHRHSLEGLKQLLPPEVRLVREVRMGLGDIPGVPPRLMGLLKRLMGETALGLGDLAVIESTIAHRLRGQDPNRAMNASVTPRSRSSSRGHASARMASGTP
jgi:4-amino-4-deoxy-L-arabinose transferase-like glycosyltransferase